jgi:hypothetical protein
MLCRAAPVRTNVSEEVISSIIRVIRIDELGTLEVTSNRSTLRRNTAEPCHNDYGGDMVLRNVGTYKSDTA